MNLNPARVVENHDIDHRVYVGTESMTGIIFNYRMTGGHLWGERKYESLGLCYLVYSTPTCTVYDRDIRV